MKRGIGVRSKKPEARSQKSGVRSKKPGARSQNKGKGQKRIINPKYEIRNKL